MEPNMRDMLILIYGSVLAFLFGIAGSLLGDALKIFTKDIIGLIIITVAIILIACSLYLEISEILGIGKTRSKPKIPLKNLYETLLVFHKKHKEDYIFRLKSDDVWKERIAFFGQILPVPVILVSFFSFIVAANIVDNPLVGLAFFGIYLLIFACHNRYEHWINHLIFKYAKKWGADIDFLIRRGNAILSNVREYHLVFSFKYNCYFFVRYDEDKILEKKIGSEVERLAGNSTFTEEQAFLFFS